MKKRNKKYNPKQIVKQKVHKFQMTWEVNEAKRIEGDFEIETNHCCLTCFSTFSSFRHEMEFKARKLMLMGQGLGVAA